MKFKSRYLKVGICIVIFLSLIGISNLMLRPVYNRIGKRFEGAVLSISQNLQEKSGLKFSYESLSPSILRGIVLKGIVVYDTQSRLPVASIKSLSLSYSVKSLINGEGLDALKILSLRDVELSIVEGENDFWLKKLLQTDNAELAAEIDAPQKDEDNLNKILGILESLDLSVLKEVYVYRLHALYKTSGFGAEGNITKAVLSNAVQGISNAVIDGSFDLAFGSQTVSGRADLNATLPKGFDGSSAVLRLANVSMADYRMRYLGFLAEYKDKNFYVRMLPGIQNFYAEFAAALETGELSAKLFADNFRIPTLITSTKNTSYMQSLSAMNFSIDAQGTYNLKTKDLSYNSAGNVYVPAAAIPAKAYADNVLVSYSVSGDKDKIRVSHLKASGNRYNFNLDGFFNFRTFQPEGNLYVDSIVLPNGGVVSTEVFIEPREKGFMCFSPQISFDTTTFTAAELNVIPSSDSWDFTFEVSDYNHTEAAMPSVVSVFGSFVPSTSAVQASLQFDTVYLDSLVLMYAFFADQSVQPLLFNAADSFSTYVFTCDSFVSLQGGDFALNIPYAFMANTARDDQMLMLSADINNESIHLSRLELAFANQRLLMNADSALLGKGQGRMLNGRLELNGIPYDFTGLINDNWLNIDSEYGFQLVMNTESSGQEAILSGIFSIEDFPIKLNDRTYAVSNSTTFSYSVSNGLNINIPRFEGRILDQTVLNPIVSFSGNLDSQGLQFDNVVYSDNVSTLTGNGTLFWLLDDGTLEDATFSFGLSSLAGVENIMFSGNISNPYQREVSISSLLSGELLQYLLVNANFNIDSLRSQRFVPTSRETDSINATLSVQGNLSNPYIAFSIPRAGFTVQNTPFILTAQATLEDMLLDARNVSLDFGTTQIQEMTAKFDVRKFTGEMQFDLETNVFGKDIKTDVFARVESVGEYEGLVPDAMEISLDTGDIITNNYSKSAPFHLGVVKMQNDFLVSSSENLGLSGIISEYKNVSLKLNNPLPLKASVEGVVSKNEINLLFTDISASLPKLLNLLDIDVIATKKGTISGGFAITGTPESPFFSGTLDITPIDFNCPSFFTKHATADRLTLVMSGSQFYTEPTRCMIRRSPIDVTVTVQMNGFSFESLDIHLQTMAEKYVPVNINLSELHVKGDALLDLDINYELEKLSVSGEVAAKNTTAEFGATRLNEIIAGFISPIQPQTESSDAPLDVALNIKALSRVQIAYSTFLRAVVVPGSEITVNYFGDQDRLLLDGDVPIKSGELSYLNTSFYIREGSIHFSDNDESFDPRITVRAETKMRDDNNENVTVTLTVDNQHLSELSPRLTASPAKSEREIMEILGNIITANAENAANFAFATGDYTIQTVFTRKLENALRDFLNLDILSLRTMVVQNAVKQGSARNSTEQTNNSNPAGNYLDGTTVYIGKYIGDSLFADAMLRLDYDENRVGDKYTLDGLSFKPEIGFELEAPFAKIRWSMSPDFEDLINLNLVQNTALTVSWKFNF